jgi:hypothetical protein
MATVVTRTHVKVTFIRAFPDLLNWKKRCGVPQHFSARKFPNYSRAKTDISEFCRFSMIAYRTYADMCSSIVPCRCYAVIFKHFLLATIMLTCLNILTDHFYDDMFKHFHLSPLCWYVEAFSRTTVVLIYSKLKNLQMNCQFCLAASVADHQIVHL